MFDIAILIISDKGFKGERKDLSAPIIKKIISVIGLVKIIEIIPDDKILIINKLKLLSDKIKINLIITTGGTGFSSRDITPEATLKVINKNIPGIPEIMRQKCIKKTYNSILSRGVAGIRKNTLIINLPGSPIACKECLEVIIKPLKHGLEILNNLTTDCSRKNKK